MNAPPCFETSVTTHAKAQCHFSEASDVCYHITNHISRIFDVIVSATGSWSDEFGHRNSLRNGQLDTGISVFIAMSTPTLGPIQPSRTGTGSKFPKSNRSKLEVENHFSVRSEIKACSSLCRLSSVYAETRREETEVLVAPVRS